MFAESGLGTEGQQTQVAINAFEKANPNIKVSIQVLSPDSTTYLSSLEHDFISGSSTPDVFESDVTYPAKFAQAGWVLPLTQFNPNTSQFLCWSSALPVIQRMTPSGAFGSGKVSVARAPP